MIGTKVRAEVYAIRNKVSSGLVIWIRTKDIEGCRLELRKRYLVAAGNEHWPCALMPLKGLGAYIMVNKDRTKKLQLSDGQVWEIQIEEIHSEYGMPMPEALAVLLEQDDQGRARFQKLSGGKQRNIIYFIAQAKNEQL